MTSISTSKIQPVNQDYFIKIFQEEFLTNKNLDEKLTKAAQTGFFYLEMPEDCKSLIGKAVEFANSFYKSKSVKELKLEGFSGYHDRENLQVESLYLERKYWKEQLPEELLKLAPKMHQLAVDVLKKTLSICKISQEHQQKISGNVTEGEGDIYFTFNHYRPEKPHEGLASHRDFGQITVLFINQVGLQAKVNEEWPNVNPLEGYVIINFGQALEHSVNNSQQVTAAWHRVEQVKKDRVSLGIFADNSMDSMIYQRTPQNEIVSTGESFKSYIQKCFVEKY